MFCLELIFHDQISFYFKIYSYLWVFVWRKAFFTIEHNIKVFTTITRTATVPYPKTQNHSSLNLPPMVKSLIFISPSMVSLGCDNLCSKCVKSCSWSHACCSFQFEAKELLLLFMHNLVSSTLTTKLVWVPLYITLLCW